MARIVLNGKTYRSANLDDISLRDSMHFKTESVKLGFTMSEIEQAAEELAELSDAEAADHPMAEVVTAVMVWISVRATGEAFSLTEAFDLKVSEFQILPDLEDRKPGKAKGAKKRPQGSVQVADEAPRDPMTATSTPPSDSD